MPSIVYVAALVRGSSSDPGIEFLLRWVELGFYGGEPGFPLHSTDLASVPWSTSAFPNRQLALTFELPSGMATIYVHGTVEQLSVSVPEPASAEVAALAALALTGLGIARARS